MPTAGAGPGRSGAANSAASAAGSRRRDAPPRVWWSWVARLGKEAWSPRSSPLGNYRQHITFAAALGVLYAWAAFIFAGIHWLYGSVAALLTTLSGLLPDLDSDSGVEMRGFTGILGVLVAVAVWQTMGKFDPEPAFEFHLWAVVCSFVMVRHGLRRIVGRLTVHRGMSHSLPTCAVW